VRRLAGMAAACLGLVFWPTIQFLAFPIGLILCPHRPATIPPRGRRHPKGTLAGRPGCAVLMGEGHTNKPSGASRDQKYE
jgi:hypothetical protein